VQIFFYLFIVLQQEFLTKAALKRMSQILRTSCWSYTEGCWIAAHGPCLQSSTFDSTTFYHDCPI